MSAVKSPNPMNLLVLAALGIGAYWILTHRAQAATRGGYSTPAGIPAAKSGNTAGSIINAVSGLIGAFGGASSGLNGTYDGRSAMPWDTTPLGAAGPVFNNPSAYVSSAIDGAAFNPPDASAYDAFAADQAGYWGYN